MSVNKVILLGNVGKDPDFTTFDNGGCVAQFPFATTDRAYKKQDGTEVPERTEWHNVVASNNTAKVVNQYVKKGDKLYIEGRLRTRSWAAQDGTTRYTTEILVTTMEMLTPKKAEAAPPPIPGVDDLP